MIKRIYIEITNKCNLACTFCKKNTLEPKFISLQEFEDRLNKIEKTCKYIYLHVQGEPLLHPNLKDFVSLAKDRGFFVNVTTNGSLIKNNMYLLDGYLRKIVFSIHSIDYQDIDYKTYINNILDFCSKASKNDDLYCELRLNNKDNKAKELSLYLENKYKLIETKKNNSYRLMNKVFLTYDSIFEWPDLTNNFVSNIGTCRAGKDMLAILANGTVSTCCLDANGLINLGNINTSSLEEILDTERYKAFMEGFKNNKAVEALCKHCSYRLRFD